MEDAGILEEDSVVVRKQEDADSGEIVAATSNGETTLKRLLRDTDRTLLVAENPRYQPIEVTTGSAVIHGFAVGLLRSHPASRRGSQRWPPAATPSRREGRYQALWREIGMPFQGCHCLFWPADHTTLGADSGAA